MQIVNGPEMIHKGFVGVEDFDWIIFRKGGRDSRVEEIMLLAFSLSAGVLE